MKKIQKMIVGMLMMSILMTSCMSFDEMNSDPTRLNKANPGTFLNPVLYEMAAYNWNRYNSYTFDLMQCRVSTSSTNGVGWYYISDGAGDGTWNNYYKWLNNIREIEERAIELNEPNYQAIAMVLRSWIYQILTDAFGNVPMSEATQGEQELFTPKFDTQHDIYSKIIADLAEANILFDESKGLRYNQGGELLYKTSDSQIDGIKNWKRFCNSLRLRVLLRVLNVSEFNSAEELRKIIDDPATYPVFTSNEEAAMLAISGVSPEVAPLTRPQDFTSYKCVSDFFVSNLLEWDDPRLPIFAQKAKNGDVSSFVGLPSGYAIAPSIVGSTPNQAICIAPMKLAMMSYGEVEFIKAELAQRGIIIQDAQQAYENGVKASIEQWGAEMPEDYFANPETAYDQSLERIMEQKFFALFFCDFQQWFEYNRTGLPQIPRGDGVSAGNKMPQRFKYPATLQRTNMKNYQITKEQMGGDNFDIKLIWQK